MNIINKIKSVLLRSFFNIIHNVRVNVYKCRSSFILASSLLNSIDPTADPCNNFFQFACGMWRKRQVIPEDKSITGVFYQVDDSVDIILKCN